MKNKLYRKYIVLIVAAIASAVVWIQSFTQSNVLHPFLFSLLFTLVMAFFVWLAFGAPRGKKSIPMKEISPFLQSIGFEPSSKPLDAAPISLAQTTKLTHGSMLAIVYSFSSPDFAHRAFQSQRDDLAKSNSGLRKEKSRKSADSSMYMRTTDQYTDVLLVADKTVAHLHAPSAMESNVEKIVKTVR